MIRIGNRLTTDDLHGRCKRAPFTLVRMFHPSGVSSSSDSLSRFRNESRTLCEMVDTEFVNFRCRWITDGALKNIRMTNERYDVKEFTSMGILLPCHAALVSVSREKFCVCEISSRHAREQRLLQYRWLECTWNVRDDGERLIVDTLIVVNIANHLKSRSELHATPMMHCLWCCLLGNLVKYNRKIMHSFLFFYDMIT